MSTGERAPREVPDEELVRQFQITGNQDYFADLFKRHRRRVYLACRGFFANASAAEDATQETFLRVYRCIDSFGGGNFGGWLMRIAKNVCIDEWRKSRPEVPGDELDLGELAQPCAVDRMSDLHLAVDKVRDEMKTLSAEQRRCLELKIDGYSYEETAVRTGLSVQAVKSHLQNGRRALWLRVGRTLSQMR
jgi:RNA polymerase sigma-70 factor, ECF subfamily